MAQNVTSSELFRLTGTHRGTLRYWASIAGVRPIGSRIIRGRNTFLWPADAASRINAAKQTHTK